MDITFLLNGESVSLTGVAPTVTLLDWLREERGLAELIKDSPGAHELLAASRG